MIDDVTLLRDYAERKSETAFAELVRRRVGLVYAVALRQVGRDAHLAHDVTQKVFVELARKAGAHFHRPTLAGWLCRTAHFTAIDLVRAERRRRAREQREPLMPDSTDQPNAAADWDRLRPMLNEAMSDLSDSDRDAVALRFFEGRTFADTGRALRLSEEAARKRVDRALEKMAGTLARRGVTSTSAALSVTLAEQAAFAAPSGLATTVTGTALAGASVAAGWSFWSFLTSAKVSLLLAAAALAAIGVAIHEAKQSHLSIAQLESVRREQASQRAQAEATRQRLGLADQRARAAEDDNAKLLAAIASLHASENAAKPAKEPPPPAAGEPQIHLRMIQLSRKDGDTDATLLNRASTILARFHAGENFADLAKEFSNDSRKDKGGDWGWTKPAELRDAVRIPVFSLNKGEVSAPLLLPEGCFILYAEDRK